MFYISFLLLLSNITQPWGKNEIKPWSFDGCFASDEPIPFKLIFRQAENYPVDLYFLLDLSYTMVEEEAAQQRLKALGRDMRKFSVWCWTSRRSLELGKPQSCYLLLLVQPFFCVYKHVLCMFPVFPRAALLTSGIWSCRVVIAETTSNHDDDVDYHCWD